MPRSADPGGSPARAERIVPRPDEVHAFYTILEERADERDLAGVYRDLLDAEERRRHRRFRFVRNRHEYLVAHALVRTTLSRFADVDARAWTFVENEHGCPRIAGPAGAPPLRFNLSHTTGLVACAVALDREVGIDVENLGRRGRTIEVADRFFSPAEVRALHALPAAARRARFFELWTLKESYIKARGMGLALPLRHFTFHLDEPGSPRISFDDELPDDPQTWTFARARPTPGHQLALAVRRGSGSDCALRLVEAVPLRGERLSQIPFG